MSTISPREFTSKTGDPFTIRSARTDDAEVLIAYVKAITQESDHLIIQADEFQNTEEEERQWVQKRLDCPGKIAILAEASEKVIGLLDFDNGSRKRIAHRGTLGMTVRREWRGRGVVEAWERLFSSASSNGQRPTR